MFYIKSNRQKIIHQLKRICPLGMRGQFYEKEKFFIFEQLICFILNSMDF